MGEMDELGVVGAIRLPAPVERLLRSVPRLAWVFVAAAFIDTAGRIVSAPASDGLSGIGFVVLPIFTRDLLILLPAVVLMRRPSVRSDAPWIFWALVLIAIGSAVQQPASAIGDRLRFTETGGELAPVIGAILVSTPWLISAAGWLCLASGFLHLKSGLVRPGASVRPGVSIVAWLATVPIAGAVIVDMLSVREAVGMPFPDGSIQIAALGALLVTSLGKGALVWLFIRAVGTPGDVAQAARPPRTALLAAALWAILTVIEAGALIATSLFTPTEALAPLYSGAWLTLYVLTPTVLVSAFALGLANRVVEPGPRSTEV